MESVIPTHLLSCQLVRPLSSAILPPTDRPDWDSLFFRDSIRSLALISALVRARLPHCPIILLPGNGRQLTENYGHRQDNRAQH